MEARDRVGGRVFSPTTITRDAVDMGAYLIEGTSECDMLARRRHHHALVSAAGNPLATLSNQLSAVRRPVRLACALYDDDGLLPASYAHVIEEVSETRAILWANMKRRQRRSQSLPQDSMLNAIKQP